MNQNFIDKKEKYIRIKDAFSKRIINFTDLLEQCEVEINDSLETIIFKKYIELNDVIKVAAYMNEEGYRITTNSNIGHRKYISNDITEVLNNKKNNVDILFRSMLEDMKEIDHMLTKMNAKKLIKN